MFYFFECVACVRLFYLYHCFVLLVCYSQERIRAFLCFVNFVKGSLIHIFRICCFYVRILFSLLFCFITLTVTKKKSYERIRAYFFFRFGQFCGRVFITIVFCFYCIILICIVFSQ